MKHRASSVTKKGEKKKKINSEEKKSKSKPVKHPTPKFTSQFIFFTGYFFGAQNY